MPSWSGFWGDAAGGSGSYALLQDKNPRRGVIRGTVNRESFRVATALFNGLIGAATGSNVTATHKRIAEDNSTFTRNGGARAIDTVTDINRNTVAGDVTMLKEMVTSVSRRPTYARDLSGNGGPAY